MKKMSIKQHSQETQEGSIQDVPGKAVVNFPYDVRITQGQPFCLQQDGIRY